jgi:hypothetical protein
VVLLFTRRLFQWAGVLDPEDPLAASSSFFLLIALLPTWVVGFCIVFAIAMSCAAYDTLQVALVATVSNDVFRNKINIWWVRVILIVNIPAVVVATKNLDILVLFLIADLVSAAVLPPILLGLVPALYFLNGFDVVVGGLGGVFSTGFSTTIRRAHLPAGFFTVFLFGLVYYDGNASAAGGLLILKDGLYADDWSAFGAFVAAPIGSMLWTSGAFIARLVYSKFYARITGRPSTVFKRKEINRAKFADQAVYGDVLLPKETVTEDTPHDHESPRKPTE